MRASSDKSSKGSATLKAAAGRWTVWSVAFLPLFVGCFRSPENMDVPHHGSDASRVSSLEDTGSESADDPIELSKSGTPSLTHDFGIVAPETEAAHEFRIRNTEDVSFKIIDVKSTCKCVVSTPTHKSIAPGDSAPILVKFTPSGRLSEDQKVVHVTIKMSDGSMRRVALGVRAFVTTNLAFVLPGISSGALPVGTTKDVEAQVVQFTGHDVAQIAVHQKPEWLIVGNPKHEMTKVPVHQLVKYVPVRLWTLPLTFAPPASLAQGDHNGDLIVRAFTRAGEVLDARLPLRLQIGRQIYITPSRLVLSETKTPGEYSGNAVLRSIHPLESQPAVSLPSSYDPDRADMKWTAEIKPKSDSLWIVAVRVVQRPQEQSETSNLRSDRNREIELSITGSVDGAPVSLTTLTCVLPSSSQSR